MCWAGSVILDLRFDSDSRYLSASGCGCAGVYCQNKTTLCGGNDRY